MIIVLMTFAFRTNLVLTTWLQETSSQEMKRVLKNELTLVCNLRELLTRFKFRTVGVLRFTNSQICDSNSGGAEIHNFTDL